MRATVPAHPVPAHPVPQEAITTMSTTDIRTVAVIGLGNMGGPMAANLAAAGLSVHGSDPSPEARSTAAAAGVVVHERAVDAVGAADAVITMLPNGAIVGAVYDELLPATPGGALFVDSSTIAVDDARELAARVAAAGHSHLDAPVSGGVVGAAAGTLAFMVGGDAATVERARPMLEIMGRSVVHCGESGAGQVAKVCNNMVLAVQQIAIGEAMVLGGELGLSPEAFHEVVSNSTGACWALTANCPVPGPVPTSPANRDFAPGFATALMDKDLGLAEHALDTAGTAAPMGRLAREYYARFLADGHGALDFSAIIEQIRADGAATDDRK